jgi:hypothetical protein
MSEQTRPQTAEEEPQGVERAADRVGDAVLFPVAVARRVLPEHDLPVYLGVGALAIAGVIDWPIAAAAGLGYAAVKRWGQPFTRPRGRDRQRRHVRERPRSDGVGSPLRRSMTD